MTGLVALVRQMPMVERIHFFLSSVFVASLPWFLLWRVFFGTRTVLKPYRIAGIVLTVFVIGDVLLRGRRPRVGRDDLLFFGLFLWGFVAGVLYSLVEGEGLAAFVKHTTLVASNFLFVWALKNGNYDRRHAAAFIQVLMVSLLVSIAVGFMVRGGQAGARFAAMYKNPVSVGFMSSVSVIFLVSTLAFSERRSVLAQALPALTLGVFSLVLVLSGARGPALGLVAAFVWVGLKLVQQGVGRRSLLGVTRLLAMGLVATLAFGAIVELAMRDRGMLTSYETGLERFRGDAGTSGGDVSSGRFDIWRAALLLGVDTGFVGVGVGRYHVYHKEYIHRLDDVRSHIHKASLGTHSTVIDLLVNYGFIGTLMFALTLLHLFAGWRRRVRQEGYDMMLLCLAGLMVLTLVSSLTVSTFQSPGYALMYGLFAVGIRPLAQKNGMKGLWVYS